MESLGLWSLKEIYMVSCLMFMGIFFFSLFMWMRYGCENIRFVKELLFGWEEK